MIAPLSTWKFFLRCVFSQRRLPSAIIWTFFSSDRKVQGFCVGGGTTNIRANHRRRCGPSAERPATTSGMGKLEKLQGAQFEAVCRRRNPHATPASNVPFPHLARPHTPSQPWPCLVGTRRAAAPANCAPPARPDPLHRCFASPRRHGDSTRQRPPRPTPRSPRLSTRSAS